MMNKNGLTWSRWLMAAAINPASKEVLTSMKAAWQRGEDPAEWRVIRDGLILGNGGAYAECDKCKATASIEDESPSEFRKHLVDAGWHLLPDRIASMNKTLCPQCFHCEMEGHADCGECDYCHFCYVTMCERCRFKSRAIAADLALNFAIKNNMDVTFAERLRDLSSAINSMVVSGECKCIKEVR